MTELRGLVGLSQLRMRAKLTQAELARELGASRVSVSNWETGASWPSAQLLPKIAEVLGCSVEDLYRDHSTDKEECPCREVAGICMQDTGERPV